MSETPREPTSPEVDSDASSAANGEAAPSRKASRGGGYLRFALFGVVLVLAVGSPLWGPLFMRQLTYFRVRNIEVEGARYIAVSEILGRLHVDTLASVWDPIASLERRLATHPQVRSVEIERRLPGTLVVHIDERRPVALIPSARGFRAYDERGIALPIDLAKTPVDAPILADLDIPTLHLLANLERHARNVYDRVSVVRPVSGDELLITLDSLKLRTLKSVSADQLYEVQPVRDDLVRRQLKVVELDLRYRDQVIARIQ